ncbi:MAG: SUMF1/EgtB/PvdO family nonheme iron enzyme [Cellvibrio sp.]|nr:SUMF1/EgtB/PvdO family nonheme iron enzyme [Cellvibrio sp.]
MALQIPGYRVIRKINQGGMATVYLAIQISVGRIVALKVMNPLLNTDPAFSERFQSEATIVGQLSHPNIVSIYDMGQHQGLNYIAMDYLPNGSAHEKMMRGISAEEALLIIKQIAAALDHAHEKGYIHRDIKPENILFRSDDTAVLTDFGVAKGISLSSRMTQAGTVVGTPHYMSPEQSKGINVDGRADIYSLGIVFFEMLTGTLPYQGDEAVTVALKHISAPLPKLPTPYAVYQKLLDKLLAKDPQHRFQRGREVVAAIEELEIFQRNPANAQYLSDQPSVVGLFRQLLQTLARAIYWRWRKLQRIRWSGQGGFYFKTATDLDQFYLETEAQNANRRHELRTQVHEDLLAERQNKSRWIIASLLFVMGLGAIGYYWKLFNENNTSLIANQSSSRNSLIASSSVSSSSTNNSLLAVSESSSSTDTTLALTTKSASSAASSIESLVTTSSSFAASSSTPSLYALTVTRDPAKASVKILNIKETYQEGVQLKPGEYHLEVSYVGHESQRRWVRINDNNLRVQFILKKIKLLKVTPITKTVQAVARTKPLMITIPGGSFFMGSKNDSTSMPVHKIDIKSFKISQFEITFSEYDHFAKDTKRNLPSDNRWGRETRPVINVSWEDAKAYTAWLSKTTGKTYRLPTESEWEFAARAKTSTDFWWGNDVNDARDRANCRRGCNSKFSGLFGSKTAPIGSYPANAFQLFDTSGNVAEWVEDCYAVDYALHPKNGTAYQMQQCIRRVVRGGSAKDNAERITNYARDYYPPEMAQENVGFRVVEEL